MAAYLIFGVPDLPYLINLDDHDFLSYLTLPYLTCNPSPLDMVKIDAGHCFCPAL